MEIPWRLTSIVISMNPWRFPQEELCGLNLELNAVVISSDSADLFFSDEKKMVGGCCR
jgi:hypothetical protein